MNQRLSIPRIILLLITVIVQCQVANGQEVNPNSWWSTEVETRLSDAADNRAEMQAALANVKYEHRRALEFLIEHMPDADLKSLKASYLLGNIELAYQAINTVPWGKQIPEHVFFNDILPYANVDETREDWRRDMMERCLPIVKDCQTPGEAAQKLNREVFPLIEVRYATSRKKANQSPSESMEQSVASCTGLSIILTDACRSVGVPSRLAGTPAWTNKRGNHTWVEVWDDVWHFTGAAEPSSEGLNHAWFQLDASLADDSKPMNRVYAVSFARTGMYFPMVWSPRSREINAVNVTRRYNSGRQEMDPDTTRVLICIRAANGTRLEREVRVSPASGTGEPLSGLTRGEDADTNDLLMFELARNQTWQIAWQEGDEKIVTEKKSGVGEQTWWEIRLEK